MRLMWKCSTLSVLLHMALSFLLCLSGCRENRSPGGANPPLRAFVDVTEQVGLQFHHQAGGARSYFFPAIMSPGGGFLDFDRDGDLDIVLVNGAPREVTNAADPLPSTCRLYRQDPPGKFVDVTEAAGLKAGEYGMGVAIGDVNNDGYPDVYMTNFGADRLFVNGRNGVFVDVTAQAGIENLHWGASAAFFDYDRDGWLDLFVTNYVDYDPAQPCYAHNGQQDFCNPAVFPRTAAKLFHNVTGHAGTRQATAADSTAVAFEDVSLSAGIALKQGAGLGVVCADFNADDWLDVYVANDGHANFLWINQRDGTFRDEAVLAGLAYDSLGRGQGSMGIALGDTNADQVPEMLVTNLDGENNSLYASLGDGSYRETSSTAGIGSASFPRTGFGTAFIDIERDGDLDLAVVNGRVRRAGSLPDQPLKGDQLDAFWQNYAEENHLFLNDGRGKFTRVLDDADEFQRGLGVYRGLAVGDVDNDGDCDLLLTASGGKARLLRNTAKAGHWLTLEVADPRYGGRDAYGAQVTVVSGARRWWNLVSPGSSYLSSHDPRVHFGLGQVTTIDAIEVLWPDGIRESFPGGSVDRFRKIEFGTGSGSKAPAEKGE